MNDFTPLRPEHPIDFTTHQFYDQSALRSTHFAVQKRLEPIDFTTNLFYDPLILRSRKYIKYPVYDTVVLRLWVPGTLWPSNNTTNLRLSDFALLTLHLVGINISFYFPYIRSFPLYNLPYIRSSRKLRVKDPVVYI